MTRRKAARSIGTAGSTAISSHTEIPVFESTVFESPVVESPVFESPVVESPASDIAEFLKLQSVQSRGHPGGLDDPCHGGVVEGPGPQRGPQYPEVLVVPGRVVAQEADLIAPQPEVSLQAVRPISGLPQA